MRKLSNNSKPRIAHSIRNSRLSLENLEDRNSPSDLFYGLTSAYSDSSLIAAADASNSNGDDDVPQTKTDAGAQDDPTIIDLDAADSSTDSTIVLSDGPTRLNSGNFQFSSSQNANGTNYTAASAGSSVSPFQLSALNQGTQPIFSVSDSSTNGDSVNADHWHGWGGGFGGGGGGFGGGGFGGGGFGGGGFGGGGGTGGGGGGTGGGGGSGNGSSTVSGYTPAQINEAYGFTSYASTLASGTLPGKGITIALIESGNDADLATNLSTFDTKFGLAAPSLSIVSQTGSSTALPANNNSWAIETDLDVEWAHAIAPGANILVVEANSSNMSDLMTAVSYASAHAQVVSMSFGGSDGSSDKTYDHYFEVPNVAFVASSGDDGTLSYPATSPYVLSVGGTTLNLSSSGAISSQTAWSDSGGGKSTGESEPAYQKALAGTISGRGNPDVSFDANPNTGVAMYSAESGGWLEIGGTSVGAPAMAGLIAIVDQGRATAAASAAATAHKATVTVSYLSTDSLTSSPFYDAAATSALYSANYSDVTSGTTVSGNSAKAGYDLATGIGTPVANKLIPWLIANN